MFSIFARHNENKEGIMKKYIFAVAAAFAFMGVNAQNVWERPNTGIQSQAEKEKEKKDYERKLAESKDARYLRGAVGEKDGKVGWEMDIELPGMTAQQIYDRMLELMTNLSKEDNQQEGSGVSLVNKQEHIIVASMREWLVFTDKFLALDRTKFQYTLIARCEDGKMSVSMERLSYRYDSNDGKGETKILAEEAINDKNALNKKGTKLVYGWAKFRRKTIDRKDVLFNTITQYMKGKQ